MLWIQGLQRTGTYFEG